jgi:hypothetical protein
MARTMTTDQRQQTVPAPACGGAGPVPRDAAGRSRPGSGTLGTPAPGWLTVYALLPPLTMVLLMVTAAALLLTAVALLPPPLMAVTSPSRESIDADPASPAPSLHLAAGVVTLAQSGSVALPADPAVVALARLIYAPSAESGPHALPGPLAITVEAGSLTVDLAAPASRHLAAQATSTVGPRVLAVGDRLVLPIDATAALRNTGSGPAVALAAGVFPAAALRRPAFGAGRQLANAAPAWIMDSAPGVTVQPLVSGWTIDPTTGTAALTLQRLSLPPGSQAPLSATDAAAVAVETGVLVIASSQGLISLQRADGSNERLTRGETATLLPGDGVLLLDGADGTLRNAGSGPLLVLHLTVSPALVRTTPRTAP